MKLILHKQEKCYKRHDKKNHLQIVILKETKTRLVNYRIRV
jgi:hypothetical protein